MALGPLAKLSVKLLKVGAKGAKKGAKTTAKAAKKGAIATRAKLGPKLAKLKSSITAGAIGALSGLGGSDTPADESFADLNPSDMPNTASSNRNSAATPAPLEDPLIGLSSLGAAIANVLPEFELPSLNGLTTTSVSDILVKKDINLEMMSIGTEEIPYIPAGTNLSSSVPDIATLYSITGMLKQRVEMLSTDLKLVNTNLATISASLDDAIEQNSATARENERRRDEQDVEDGNIPDELPEEAPSKIKEFATDMVKAAGLSVLASAANYTKAAVAAGTLMVIDAIEETGDDAAQDTEEVGDSAVQEETAIIEEASALDNALAWIDKAESNDNDKTFMQSVVGSGLSAEASIISGVGLTASVGAMGAGALGAAGTAAALATTAAAVAAFGTGFAIGTVINEQTGLKQGIEGLISDNLAGDSIDLGTMQSDTYMKEKYNGKGGAELLGDLLGEGAFDLAEAPEEIIAAFKDVDSLDAYNALDSEYQAKYERPLTSALNDVLGTKGVESVFNLITANAIQRIKKESSTSAPETKMVNGFKVRKVESPTELQDKEIGGRAEADTIPEEKVTKSLEIYGMHVKIGDTMSLSHALSLPPDSPLSYEQQNDPSLVTITDLSAGMSTANLQKLIIPESLTDKFPDYNAQSIQNTLVPNNSAAENIVVERYMPDLSGEVKPKAEAIVPIIIQQKPNEPKTKLTSAGTTSRSQTESATSSSSTSDAFLMQRLVS